MEVAIMIVLTLIAMVVPMSLVTAILIGSLLAGFFFAPALYVAGISFLVLLIKTKVTG